jgi:RNA polymerase sigma-70 factor, ECF subfamily
MNYGDEDFDLVRKFVNGDESSFNKIVNKYQKKIYWIARRMSGNHLDADDIVQDVLITMYKNLKNFQFKSSLFTWVYKVTYTRTLNHLKRRKVKEAFSIEDKNVKNVKEDYSVLKNLEDKEKLEKVEHCLQQIPRKQREVFIMRNFDELSYEEISQITGTSVGALKANYFHSIKKLMELMNDDG